MSNPPKRLEDCICEGVLRIRVTPKASSERIVIEGDANGETVVRIHVTTVPEDGKANDAVIQLLAKILKLPKSALTITHGLTNRNKTIAIRQ